jgi:hypothetical protein
MAPADEGGLHVADAAISISRPVHTGERLDLRRSERAVVQPDIVDVTVELVLDVARDGPVLLAADSDRIVPGTSYSILIVPWTPYSILKERDLRFRDSSGDTNGD